VGQEKTENRQQVCEILTKRICDRSQKGTIREDPCKCAEENLQSKNEWGVTQEVLSVPFQSIAKSGKSSGYSSISTIAEFRHVQRKFRTTQVHHRGEHGKGESPAKQGGTWTTSLKKCRCFFRNIGCKSPTRKRVSRGDRKTRGTLQNPSKEWKANEASRN